MSLNIASAKDAEAHKTLLARIGGARKADYEARYDYAPADALLQPLEELPGDSQFIATYRPPFKPVVGAEDKTPVPQLAADFAEAPVLGENHVTAYLATLSLRQVILGAIDKQPLAYFIGPEAVTQPVLQEIVRSIHNAGRIYVDDPKLHLLCRQVVYSGSDLTQYDRIVMMVRVNTKRKAQPNDAEGAPELRANGQKYWRDRTAKLLTEKFAAAKGSALSEGAYQQRISDATMEGRADVADQLRGELQAVRDEVDAQIAQERKTEADELAQRRKEAAEKLKDTVKGNQSGWVLAVVDNMAERDFGRAMHIISALPGGQQLPETIDEGEASGVPVSVEALRLVPRMFAGVFREYYSINPVGAYPEFGADAYDVVDRITLDSADRRSLPLMLYYAGLLSRTHKRPLDDFRTSPYDAVYDKQLGGENFESLRRALRLSLGLRRFRETEVDDAVEPYARSLDQQNAKPTARPRLVPLDYLARAASERNPALARKLERAAEQEAQKGQLPGLDSVSAAKATSVPVYKSPAQPAVRVELATEYDTTLRPFMSGLGGLFGQRWNNNYFNQTVALEKLMKDVAASNSKSHELCNVFPLYALLPPPSMMLDDDVVRYLRRDPNRLAAIDAYVAAHRSDGTDVDRLVVGAWDAVANYIAEVRRSDAPDRALLKANVDRLNQFVDDRDYSEATAGSSPLPTVLERRFLITGEETYQPLWSIVHDKSSKALEAQTALRRMTYAQHLEAMLIDMRVGLLERGAQAKEREDSVALLAVLLPMAALGYPPLKEGNKQLTQIVNRALEVSNKNTKRSTPYTWGPRSTALKQAIDAATAAGAATEFEGEIAYLPAEALKDVRARFRQLDAQEVAKFVGEFVKTVTPDKELLISIGRMALRSAPHVVRVRTLADLAKANSADSAIVVIDDGDSMNPTTAQFGELQSTLERGTLRLGEALWGKDPELREIELRLASASNDSAKLAAASYDLDVYGQRAKSVNNLKNEALAEASYVRAQRRGRIVNVYAQTPALVYRYMCARQFALFTELFELVKRDPDFWATFAYSEKEVQNTQQTFGRLASLPLAQWNVKDIEEAHALLVSEVDRTNGLTIQRAHGIDAALYDSAIVREAARAISADERTLRSNGLAGAASAFLAFGRGYYASVRSLIDILRELRDDVALVEDNENSVSMVAIDDLLHETARTLRNLDETRQTISPLEDYSGEAVVAQRRLTSLRYMLRDRYFYEVAPQNSSNPRRVGGESLETVGYGAFAPAVNKGVSIGFVEHNSDTFDDKTHSACLVRLLAVPDDIKKELATKDARKGHLADVGLRVYIDHSGFLASTEIGMRLRNFLTSVFIEGGVEYGFIGGFTNVTDDEDNVPGSAGRIASALFVDRSEADLISKSIKPFEDRHDESWNGDLGKQAFDSLKKHGVIQRPYSDEAAARALREVLAARMSMIEDLCEVLHRNAPTARHANLYRASVMLALTRTRPDGTVNVTTASVGDMSMVAMTYPLVTDSRNVARTYDRVREIQADELADADAYGRAIRAARELPDEFVIGDVKHAGERSKLAGELAKILDDLTTIVVPNEARDDPNNVAPYLERIAPDSKETFKEGANFVRLFKRINDMVTSYTAANEIYNAEASSRVAVSNRLSAGARFSPEESLQHLLDQEKDLKEMTNEDERVKAARALAEDIALYDYLVEIGSGRSEAETILARANASDQVVAAPLAAALKDNPVLRNSKFSDIEGSLAAKPDANMLVWLKQSLQLRATGMADIIDEADASMRQGNFIRQVLENERSHLEQTARTAAAQLQAALGRFGVNIPVLHRRENRAEVPLFFYIAEVSPGYVPTRRERLQTMSLLAQLVRIGSDGLQTVKRIHDQRGKLQLVDFALSKQQIADLLRADETSPKWVIGYSSTAAVEVVERALLEKMIVLQQLVQNSFSIASQRQMLPVVRALRELGSSEDMLDTRVALPMPMATANTPRDGDRYREQVLVDKNSIAKVSLLPSDLFWRPFTVVDFSVLSKRIEAVRGKRGSTEELLEEYFSRVNLVCGVERSPFSMGNLWLKRRGCAATFEQIRAYAQANGSGPLYAEYLAGRYVSEDSRLLPIASAEPNELVRVSSYDLTTADRAYFVVSGNFSRFLPPGLLADAARRASHRLEAHLSIAALDNVAAARLKELSAKRDVEDRDQLSAALGSRLAADEVLIAATMKDRKAYLKQYDRRAFGTDDPARFASNMLASMEAHFKRRVESIMRDALRRDASLAGDKMQPIDPAKAEEAARSALNAEFGLMYFGPLAPAAIGDLESGRLELARVLDAKKLFDPTVRYAPKSEGQTERASHRMITARTRFLLHVG